MSYIAIDWQGRKIPCATRAEAERKAGNSGKVIAAAYGESLGRVAATTRARNPALTACEGCGEFGDHRAYPFYVVRDPKGNGWRLMQSASSLTCDKSRDVAWKNKTYDTRDEADKLALQWRGKPHTRRNPEQSQPRCFLSGNDAGNYPDSPTGGKWRVMYRGMPMTNDKATAQEAITAAGRQYPKEMMELSDRYWDCRGNFHPLPAAFAPSRQRNPAPSSHGKKIPADAVGVIALVDGKPKLL